MQGQRLLFAVMSGIAAFTMVTPVLALEMSVPDGWYLEGNLGEGHLSNSNSNSNFSGTTTNNDRGLAYNLNAGYKFMPYAALEAGYTHYHSNKIDYNGIALAEVGRYSYDLAAKGILPITNSGFEAFAKLGAAHMNARASNVNTAITGSFRSSRNATSVYLGLGGQFNVMQEMGIVVQWQRAEGNNNTGTEDLYSIGIAFIFV